MQPVPATTCTIAPITVNLGDANARDLNKGTASADKPATLQLICDKAPTGISYQMIPASTIYGDSCNGTMESTGTAKNVGIQFSLGGRRIIKKKSATIADGTTKTVDVPFSVHMIKTGGATTGGTVIGKATVTFVYK